MTVTPLQKFRNSAFVEGLHTIADQTVGWQSPSNIAIVKYWGKKNGQFPLTPSLSLTLSRATTRTTVHAFRGGPGKGLVSVNGDANHPFLPKMTQLLAWMSEEIPVLQETTLEVVTENSFPHSTGIASSASGISAFTLCLLDLANTILGTGVEPGELVHMASFASRMGSGSACRSLYGGYAFWGESPLVTGSSDAFAVPVTGLVHPDMVSLKDAILVISGKPKSLPSTLGHKGMEGHPFYSSRIVQANKNMEEALQALCANDFEKLASVAENEALTLHALIMSANHGTLLMKPATVEAVQCIRDARRNGLPLFFTLDAGANVHVLYPSGASREVEQFIGDALQPLCEEGRVIFDGCGNGPVKLNESLSDS